MITLGCSSYSNLFLRTSGRYFTTKSKSREVAKISTDIISTKPENTNGLFKGLATLVETADPIPAAVKTVRYDAAYKSLQFQIPNEKLTRIEQKWQKITNLGAVMLGILAISTPISIYLIFNDKKEIQSSESIENIDKQWNWSLARDALRADGAVYAFQFLLSKKYSTPITELKTMTNNEQSVIEDIKEYKVMKSEANQPSSINQVSYSEKSIKESLKINRANTEKKKDSLFQIPSTSSILKEIKTEKWSVSNTDFFYLPSIFGAIDSGGIKNVIICGSKNVQDTFAAHALVSLAPILGLHVILLDLKSTPENFFSDFDIKYEMPYIQLPIPDNDESQLYFIPLHPGDAASMIVNIFNCEDIYVDLKECADRFFVQRFLPLKYLGY